MSALEKAKTSLKNGLFRKRAAPTITIKGMTIKIESMGLILLFILSVNGSAFPKPPQIPQAKPE